MKFLIATLLLVANSARAADVKKDAAAEANRKPSSGDITIRTEDYPRPPYSGATYYIYERFGKTICTKLKVCNKFDDCEVTYYKGSFKDSEDVETGNPYGQSPATTIPADKLAHHMCLTKFKLN